MKPYPECPSCPLFDRGKLVASRGAVTTDIAIVGEAPGRVEVAMGKPFVGPSGELLHDVLQQLGLDKVFITNAALCYGGTAKEIILAAKCCHPRLVRELRIVGAATVVALGNTACGSLLGNWTGISKARGRFIEMNGWRVLPTYHPAAILRNPNLWQDFATDMEKLVKPTPTAQPDVTYTVVPDYLTVLSVLRYAATVDFAVIDLETTGLDFQKDEILCIVIGLPAVTWIIPAEIVAIPAFASALEACKAKWVGHNIQFDRKFLLYRLGVDLKITFDTMLGHYLLDERRGVHGLKEICGTLFDAPDWEAALNLGKSHNYAGVPKDVLYKYAAQDGIYTRRLAYWERDELKPYPKLIKLSKDLLVPLSNVLAEVEMRGVQIDRPALAQATEQLQRERDEQEHLCITLAGHTFNPRSPQQVGRVLFDELGLPDLLDRSTAKEVLAQLKNEHPFISALLEYRQIEKLLGTYALPIAAMLDQAGRLHTQYHIMGTVTGRLSSSSPNLQNCPARGERAKLIKNLFVASQDMVLVNVDLQQVEVRLAAVYSQDPFLLEVFQTGRDIHGETAAELFGPDYTKEQRTFIKRTVFGTLYGEGPAGLAKTAGVEVPGMTEREARMFIDRFYRKMAGLVSWINSVKRDLHEQGYVESPTGRRRRFPLLFDDNRAQAEREAVNFMCQSAASDIMLYTLVRIDSPLKAMGAHILLTVHDSVLVECLPNKVNDVIDLVVKVMAFTGHELYGDSVPFTADAEVGIRWGDLEEREV